MPVVLYLYRVEARLDELFRGPGFVLEEIAEATLAPGRLDEQDPDPAPGVRRGQGGAARV